MQQPALLPFAPDSDWFRCTAHFLDQIEARTGSTGSRVEYRNVLIAFLSSNPKPPADYTREDIENFIFAPCRRNQRRGQPPSAGTVNNRLTILASWFKYALTFAVAGTDGAPAALYCGTPPTTNIRLLNRGRAPYKALTPDELRQFFAAIPRNTIRGKRDYALCLCYLMTARRRAEIIRLRWRDIEPVMFVEDGVQRPGWQYTFIGKGRSRSPDRAELAPCVKLAIDDYLRAAGRLATIGPDDPIFTKCEDRPGRGGYDLSQPLDVHAPGKIIERYARTIGMQHRITTHSFRHTCARERFNLTHDVREIQRLLRHSSLATTDIYLAQLNSAADPGVAAFESRFGGL